jgi:NADPH:quinone reductase-like Zn-dependent oxidoreductase
MANQAWQITSPGQLTLTDLGATLPKPGPKQTLIRIHAVSLNYRDKLVVEHSQDYPIIAEPNLVPASDGAGVVEEAGLGSHWNKGDRIIVQPNAWTGTDERDYELANTMGGGRVEGTLRRFKIVDDTRLIKAPDGLSFEEASTIYTAGATAYRALFYNSARPLKPGMTVLTQGTGGVSCYAIMVTLCQAHVVPVLY